jgi:hypothetical protein
MTEDTQPSFTVNITGMTNAYLPRDIGCQVKVAFDEGSSSLWSPLSSWLFATCSVLKERCTTLINVVEQVSDVLVSITSSGGEWQEGQTISKAEGEEEALLH